MSGWSTTDANKGQPRSEKHVCRDGQEPYVPATASSAPPWPLPPVGQQLLESEHRNSPCHPPSTHTCLTRSSNSLTWNSP
jgi:hypothetical protein